MSVGNRISLKTKTYLLVLLSAVVALVLSFVSNNGLDSLSIEMDDLIFAIEIERYTNKLILEEQSYRLNTNGSIYDIEEANKAYTKAIKHVEKIYQILNQANNLVGGELLPENLQKIRHSTNEYKKLYLTGVALLIDLNKQADILGVEGEYITRQIQEYVEAKRVEIRQDLSQKTIEKINNGSNVWQYTYVTRLYEKKYRLNPDAMVYAAFKKDFQFMMEEWSRLKRMSSQPFEFEKLEKFNHSARLYENTMRSWVETNERFVLDVLPKMKQLGENIIADAVLSAEHSVNHMSAKRSRVAMILLVVSVTTIILGLLFGAMIAKSITSIVTSFQNGLLSFFQYLNQEKKSAQPIIVHGRDEVAVMAAVINENIIKIQEVMDRKADYQQALLEWSKVDYQDHLVTLNRATELSAKALHVERVGIWIFNDDKTVLTCIDLFERSLCKHTSGAVLTAEEFPDYFNVVGNGDILAVSRAREDARTCAFNEKYLKPLDIYSMLDLPIIQGDQLIGIICHESVGEIKSWRLDEQEFASSVVNAISLSLEIKKRRLIQEELKAQKEIFHYHAHHDALTDLPNRFLFDDRLSQAIKQAQRSGTKIAVLFLDLDHFKRVNDSMGHKVGDELLVEVARRLQSKIRQTDTLARLGGDEFAIVLDNVANLDVVVNVTRDLLQVMDAPIELSNQSFFVTVSVGVVIFPDDGGAPEELLKHADTAMYQAKEDGRNTYQFYTHTMTEKAFERIAMEASFRNALSREEFVVHYQPQVDANTGRFIGMEALIRWMHPDMGLVFPSTFLSFANETGLIIPMDQWVMKAAMSQIARWYQNGLQPGVLALNVSMRQLQKDDFVDTLQLLLAKTRCQPQWLELEVTEEYIMEDASMVVQVLNEVKDLGISLAIDDFGTGYSSLSQLKRLPINTLKIDRSFVRDLPHDDEDVVISKTIIALCRNMGLNVVAEGVETEEQKDFLLQNGCHYIQGYYYAKPMLAADLEVQLRAQAQV
ncbi:MAG: EAL domain-containing protein [Gammaproteobacteria bacterium]|nr:EAL domain-containing protein [Gammaproteobacteria bacterium]